MKIRLTQPARIRHEAGDVVDAPPAQAGFLLSIGAAERLEAEAEKQPAKKPAGKKKPRE